MATLEEDELELNHKTKAKQVHTTTKHDINITIYFNVAIHECAKHSRIIIRVLSIFHVQDSYFNGNKSRCDVRKKNSSYN